MFAKFKQIYNKSTDWFPNSINKYLFIFSQLFERVKNG